MIKRPSKQYKKWRIAIVAFILLIVIATVVLVGRPAKQSAFLTSEIQSRAGFPLYYPARLPSGYTVDKTTLSTTNKVVTYQIKDPRGKSLFVSLQPRPNNFDIEAFNREVISDGISLTTTVGAATIGRLRENQVASILTEETWVLISDPNAVPQQELKTIVQHLSEATP
jgi:hypothetical protein